MKNLKITWKGVSPLIMHSCQGVNPLNPITKELKKYTSKRNKTDDDLNMISNLEWESGAYWKDGLGLYIPAENVEATIRNGGKAFKKGKDFEKYVTVTDLYIPFFYGENLSKEELIQNYEYRDTRIMTVQRSKIVRTRPSTPSGQFLEFTFMPNIVIFYEKRYLEDAGCDALYCNFNR